MDCPLHDSLLRLHYKGMLLNEERTVFYDTRIDNNGQPLEFSSGEGLVSFFFPCFSFLQVVLFFYSCQFLKDKSANEDVISDMSSFHY